MGEHRINLRFGAKPDDKRAFEYLSSLDMKKWKSYNRFIIEAINYYADMLEGRRQRDELVSGIVEGVVNALRVNPVLMIGSVASAGSDSEYSADIVSDEDVQAGLDFIDM